MKRLVAYVFAILLLTTLGLLCKCNFDRHIRRLDLEVMEVASEDVAKRISDVKINLNEVLQSYRVITLTRARSLAQIVSSEPKILEDYDRFANLAKVLNVDELHVSDSNGVLIASVPKVYAGYQLGSKPRSAAFLPAITNRNFEFVQDAMIKGIGEETFQYAGVARQDQPGIVIIGLSPTRVKRARSIADVNRIAANYRVGRGGHVDIRSITATESFGAKRFQFTPLAVDKHGTRICRYESDCGSCRIMVTMPVYGWHLADDDVYPFILYGACALTLLLVLSLCFGYCRRIWRDSIQAIRLVFVGSNYRVSSATWFRYIAGAALVFMIGIFIAWNISSASAKRHANKQLKRVLTEVVEDVSSCVDEMLFFIGNAITRHHQTPTSLSQESVNEIMHRYDIDELNVVDARGIVLLGNLAIAGFDFHSTSNTAKFLKLLDVQNDEPMAQPFRSAVEDPSIVRKYAGVAFPGHDGFIQIGFDQKRMERDVDYRLKHIADSWSIGESGYVMLARVATGEIISSGSPKWSRIMSGKGSQTLSGIGLNVLDIPDEPGKMFEQILYGEEVYCTCVNVDNYHQAMVVMPKADVRAEVMSTVLVVALILFTVLVVMVLIAVWLTSLVVSLRTEKAAAKEAQRREFTVAKTIQVSSLPAMVPENATYRIYPKMVTAREVGGDFYDFYTTPSGRVLFLIADVSGKGISAAMFMMKAKAIIKACVMEYADLETVIAEANNRLAEFNDAGMFVTCWVGTIDVKTGDLEFVNAGHNPPLIRRADSSVEWVRTRPGMALAAFGGAKYHTEHISLKAGDSIFLYTDGVTEAMNAAGELYGEKRLECTLKKVSDKFVTDIYQDVIAFVNGAEQSDDITMLAFDYKPKLN